MAKKKVNKRVNTPKKPVKNKVQVKKKVPVKMKVSTQAKQKISLPVKTSVKPLVKKMVDPLEHERQRLRAFLEKEKQEYKKLGIKI